MIKRSQVPRKKPNFHLWVAFTVVCNFRCWHLQEQVINETKARFPPGLFVSVYMNTKCNGSCLLCLLWSLTSPPPHVEAKCQICHVILNKLIPLNTNIAISFGCDRYFPRNRLAKIADSAKKSHNGAYERPRSLFVHLCPKATISSGPPCQKLRLLSLPCFQKLLSAAYRHPSLFPRSSG
jgi:hypothetical protein